MLSSPYRAVEINHGKRTKKITTEIENWERCNTLHYSSQAQAPFRLLRDHLQAILNLAVWHYPSRFSPWSVNSPRRQSLLNETVRGSQENTGKCPEIGHNRFWDRSTDIATV
jgi:hypothetical protein